MNYRSINDLNNIIKKNLYKFPRDLDLIIGIPRSGMLVAYLIALYLNLPYIDLDGFIAGNINFIGKSRSKFREKKDKLTEDSKILVVDDSVLRGTEINNAKERLLSLKPLYNYIYSTIYIEPGKEDIVDIYLEKCKSPRLFEWNILNHYILQNSCVDIDGVLNRDPLLHENDDSSQYINFLRNCEPLHSPDVPIKYLITCRLEKYRGETELWLKKNNIKYEKLIMMNYSSMKERQTKGKHAEFKAYHYLKSNADLFIESSLRQANKITKLSGKPVYCLENNEMIYPPIFGILKNIYKNLPHLLRKKLLTSSFGNYLSRLSKTNN